MIIPPFSKAGRLPLLFKIATVILGVIFLSTNLFAAERIHSPSEQVIPPTSIVSFQPSSAKTGDTVIITGFGFTGATSVLFGGVPAANFWISSDSLIEAIIDTGASGAVKIITPFGMDSANGFIYGLLNQPVILSFSPDSATILTPITITGQNFTGATAVSFGGVPASFYVLSDTSIQAIPGPGASGNVSVTTSGGTATVPGFTYNLLPAPQIKSFSPDSATAGTTVSIIGKYFTNTNAVLFGGTNAASFTVFDDTLIYALVGNGTTGMVTVTTTSGMDSLAGFIFKTQAPQIHSFTPTGTGQGKTVTIDGQYFLGATSVSFGGVPASSFSIISDTMIQAITDTGASGNITVVSPAGTATISGFVFLNQPLPQILYFTPDSANQGTTVNIIGIHFTGTQSVSFGGNAAASFTVISDTLIQATVGYGSSGQVTVTTPGGPNSLGGFIYIPPPQAVTISSFTPAQGPAGTIVNIYGTHFTNTTGVRFGNSPAAFFTVISDSLINAVVGNGSTGNVWVSTTVNGMDSLSGFTFETPLYPPVINSFSPTAGNTGLNVTIYGLNFTNTASVSFGGVPAVYYQVISDSVIQAVVGLGASGNVQVITSSGVDSLAGFVYSVPAVSPQTPAFKLAQFTASLIGNRVIVQWQTNNDYQISNYQVERATDSSSYTTLNSVPSKKDSGLNYYAYPDALVNAKSVHYRLGITDSLGNITYSNIASISPLTNNYPESIKIYPNPTSGYLVVGHPISTGASTVTILDMTGKQVKTVNVLLNTNSTRVDLSGLLPGIYQVYWKDGYYTYAQTLMIQ